MNKIIKLNIVNQPKVDGNLALSIKKAEYTEPKILKLVPRKNNRIFCGCWQVANQTDEC